MCGHQEMLPFGVVKRFIIVQVDADCMELDREQVVEVYLIYDLPDVGFQEETWKWI